MRFLSYLKALIYWMICLFLLLSCISYRSSDVSFNTASSTSQNWMGNAGAYTADLLLQWFGVMAILLIAASGIYGLLAWKQKSLYLRYILLSLCILLGCWLCAGYETQNTRYFIAGIGGYLGFWLGRWGVITVPWIRSILWILWGILFVYALHFPIRLILMRIIQSTPLLLKLLPAIHKAEKIVAPLKKVKLKKVEHKTQKQEQLMAKMTSQYHLPSVDLLNPSKSANTTVTRDMIEKTSRALESVLAQFHVKGRVVGSKPGPIVTLYEFEPAAGIKVSRVISLADSITMNLGKLPIRMAPVLGTNVIGIEIPNSERETVYIRELIDTPKFESNTGALPLVLGKDIGGTATYADLEKMPHLLVAGTTGSGKSVAINTMILSLLYRFTPAECRLILVDPKMVELSIYNNIPHLLTPVVTEASKAVVALKWAVREMEDRKSLMTQMGVKNITSYNQKVSMALKNGQKLTRRVQTGFDAETGHPIIEEQILDMKLLPRIVIIVDEMSDLMGQCGKEAEPPILRLAQMARAFGIHLILATQRPSVDVVTGLIKANFPSRISFQVTNKIDSRTILDEQGAEQLLGRGDMLYRPAGIKPIRLHGPFVTEEEVERVTDFWRLQGAPNYVEAVITDTDSDEMGTGGIGDVPTGGDLYDQAVAIILRDKKVSTSYVQRCLRIGYNRAADLIDRMEREGVISKPNIAGKREILVPTDNA